MVLAMSTGEIVGTIIFAIGFVAFVAFFWNKNADEAPREYNDMNDPRNW
tara:strand:- start:1249 stop:1395 length:147 start_codon:yes stop_codon:yes gene_type:complete